MRIASAIVVAMTILVAFIFVTVVFDKYETITIREEITPAGYLEEYDAL